MLLEMKDILTKEQISLANTVIKLSYFSKMQKIIWINCSEFYIILLYGNFCFSLRTSRNVHLMNVQYMKLKVVYSTNIAF